MAYYKALDKKTVEVGFFINGEYIQNRPRKNVHTLTNPSDGTCIAYVDVASGDDVRRAVSAARQAFDGGVWSRMSVKERSATLRRFAELIRANAEFLGTLEALNVGKLHKECMHHEVLRAADNLEFFANLTEEQSLCSEVFVQRSKFLHKNGITESRVVQEPIGVAGIIVPWNSPLMLGTWNIAPALATGNTVVLKPPVWAPLSLIQLGHLANEAGIPEGVLNIVTGDAEAGKTLVTHEDVNRISFTGSVDVGKQIQIANAHARFAPVLLELGGKAPNIVFPDADLDFAVQGVARSIFRSQGQSCVAGSRLLLHSGVYEKFMKRLVEYTRAMKIGNHMEEGTDIGPVITRVHRARVMRYIGNGEAVGAKLLCGGSVYEEGECARGNFIQPTIFENVTSDMRIFQEEIFGPVLSVTPFKDTQAAVSLANSTPFGLSGNIWTGDEQLVEKVVSQIKAGMIWINSHFVRDLRTPFGGMKKSGVGRSGGEWSLDFFTEPKMVCAFKEK